MRIPIFSVSSLINQDLDKLTSRFFEELYTEGKNFQQLQEPSGIPKADHSIKYIS